MNNPFPVRLRAAAIIPRWSIIHRLQQDYLSSHSWFVAVYACQIARMIEWTSDIKGLMWEALTHDIDEVITGDFLGPIKREVVDPQLLSRFVSRKMDELMPGLPRLEWEPKTGTQAKAIIKAADQLDALLYAIGEEVLGNGVIGARIPSCYDKLREAWFKLPCSVSNGYISLEDELNKMFAREALNPHTPPIGRVPKKLADLWLGPVLSAIAAHKDPLQYDIGK